MSLPVIIVISWLLLSPVVGVCVGRWLAYNSQYDQDPFR